MPKVNINIQEGIFNKAFLPYLDATTPRFEIFYGGAGSGKSVFIAQRKVYHHLKFKNRKTLVIRKVGRTLRHSAFAEVMNVVRSWNLGRFFKVNKSDMEIFNLVNGNQFIFSGLDDVEKMKSISGITDIWIEEASEISQDDFQQLNLRLRGQSENKQITLSFNPISALSWIKAYFFDAEIPDCVLFKTTYKDNQFLDAEYIQQIEALKDKDPVYWRIYGLGEWGVLGSLVYTNWVVRDFPLYDDEGNSLFPVQYNGVDWGFNDPAAMIKIGFKDEEIYILNEFYAKGLTNTELIQEAPNIFNRRNDYLRADSSEPARIKEWRKHGWQMLSAKKGKDSITFGIDFIRRHRINIHPSCQNFKNEIECYAYREDRDGNILEEPVDFKDHLMDAMRYALEDLALERRIKWAS